MEQAAGGGPGPRTERCCSSPAPRARARGVRVAAGASRCARGGARAASAGSPGGGEAGRDPQPKKPRGRSGAAAVREGGQVGLSGARGFASCF